MEKSEAKILLCDDSILARKSLTGYLNNLGYQNVIEGSNGEEAVTKFDSEHPDIVLLDIVMPVKDGVTATREIIEKDPDANIIIISSVGTQTNLKEAIKAGAKDFVQKPVDKDILEQVLNNILS